MKDQENLLGMAEKALHDFLKNIPGIKLSLVKKNIAQELYQPDLILKVQWQNIEKLIIVEVKSRGEARQAREAAYTLINLLNRYKADYSLFIAPYISADAKKLFDSENIGYLDFSDNGKFNIGDIYIEKEGGVNKHAEKRRLRTLYSTMASRVLRGLLSEPGKEWRTVELAKVADVSLGLVSNVRKLLRERVWIREGKNSFALKNPMELIAEWTTYYSYRKNKVYNFYSFEIPRRIEQRLDMLSKKHNLKYALTLFSAAIRMAPIVPDQRLFAYVEGSIDEISSYLDLKEVSSGANIILLSPFDEGVFMNRKEYEGIFLVSPLQAYLDLKSFKGRGEEAADAILEDVIEPQW